MTTFFLVHEFYFDEFKQGAFFEDFFRIPSPPWATLRSGDALFFLDPIDFRMLDDFGRGSWPWVSLFETEMSVTKTDPY